MKKNSRSSYTIIGILVVLTCGFAITGCSPEDGESAASQEAAQVMKRYRNLGGDSGIVAYEDGKDFIRVQFSDGSIYLYNYTCPGSNDVEHMKQLAEKGQGLNSFISRVIRKRYAAKER